MECDNCLMTEKELEDTQKKSGKFEKSFFVADDCMNEKWFCSVKCMIEYYGGILDES